MTEKQSLSDTKIKNLNFRDICPVCDKNLYHNEHFSKRVGLLDEDEEVVGWLCPFCKTEFDFNEKVVSLMRDEEIRGEA